MDIRAFAEKIFAAGRERGYSDMEVYMSTRNQFQVRVFKGEIDSYTLAESRGLSFRGLVDGKMGYSYTENIGEDSIEYLIGDAIENAGIIATEDPEEIYPGSASYKHLDIFSQNLDKLTATEKIDWTKAVESRALELDDRIFSVQVQMGTGLEETTIINTQGLDVSERKNFAMGFINVVVKAGDDTKSSYSFEGSRDFAKLDARKLAEKAVQESLSLLGARSVESGSYPVLLRNDTAATFLATFASSFSAEQVQKGLSLLRDRIGTEVASPLITIVDDPHMEDRPAAAAFDAEGVCTRTKNIVEDGKLVTYLHNIKTARKDGVESTGNAYKASFNSPVGVAPTNLYIAPGENSYEDMLAEMDRGIVIIALQGTHAGANPVSGDFSLSAYGYLVENGKVTRPVNQITVAGNFFAMLSDVQSVGNDLDFGMTGTGAPSLLIKSLSVAGE